jgi:hypothetical protein
MIQDLGGHSSKIIDALIDISGEIDQKTELLNSLSRKLDDDDDEEETKWESKSKMTGVMQ